jgi:hypothetical protein
MPNTDAIKAPLADHQLVFQSLKQNQISIDTLLPQDFLAEQLIIEQLKGAPLSQLIGGIIDCGAGLFLYVLGGRLAKQCRSLTLLEQYTLAASPLMVGGLLRIWAAAKTDEGYGKDTILTSSPF